MFVSILQLMGFGLPKPIQSRAGEDRDTPPSKVNNKGIKRMIEDHQSPERSGSVEADSAHAAAASPRRQTVNAQTRKPTAKVNVKKAVVKAKPKAPVKATTRVASTAPARKKAAAPAPARPKAAVKATTKSATKSVAKPAAKPAAKSGVRAAAPSVAKTATQSSTKPTVKPAVSKTTATVAKKGSMSKSVTATAAPEKTTKAAAAAVASPRADTRAAVAPAPLATAVAAPPKPVRVSARLASITVPSMAPAVASTAAKASYSQTMSTPVLVPPPNVAARKDPALANNWKTRPVDQLTDADVLAMPDAEYMNEAQMAFFRLKLVTLKRDILNSAGETTEHLREDTVVVPDPADRATIEEEHALELRTRDRERKLLKKIEQSINQIDAGEYGYCDETGEPIGVGRLIARPTATLSLEAQQRRELKQKMFGD